MGREYIFKPYEVANITKLYKLGFNWLEISEKLNIPKYSIERYLNASGLTKLSKADKLPLKTKELIISLYKNNKSITNIEFELKITKRIIKMVLEKEGIFRDYKESMVAYSKQNKLNSDFFNTIDTEQKAYWLGFIYADGNINKDITMLSIGLKIDDIDHLKLFGNIFNTEVKIYKQKAYKTMPERLTASLRITNKYICEQLNAKGIVPRKSYVDNIEVFKYIPDSLIHHFIRGFFDGDGCISKTKYPCISFSNSNLSFLNIINNLIFKYTGFMGNIRTNPRVYELRFSSKEKIIQMKQFLYKDATIFLDRKHNVFPVK